MTWTQIFIWRKMNKEDLVTTRSQMRECTTNVSLPKTKAGRAHKPGDQTSTRVLQSRQDYLTSLWGRYYTKKHHYK